MVNKGLLGASLAVALLVSACSQGPAEIQGGLEAQFGSPRDDRADVVTTDAARGRVYVAGEYAGPYDDSGTTARGDVVFFRRHNRDGSLAWKVSANAEAQGVTASVTGADTDRAGNVYFAWSLATAGSVERGFVSKYSSGGRLLFRKELPGAYQVAVATDAQDNLYLATSRRTSAGKVEKFSSSGRQLWTKTLPNDATSGSPVRPAGLDLAPDGSVYVAADTFDQPLLLKLRASDGKLLKTVGVAGDTAGEVRVGGGSVYVYSVLNTPFHFEPRVSRFRPDGSRVWERRGDFGGDETSGNLSYDSATGGISADTRGNVYLTGTFVERDGAELDVRVRKYTPSGSVAYTRRFIDPATDAYGLGVAASGSELYVVGSTDGKVNGRSSGGREAFLTRLDAQGQKVWER